MIGYYNLDSIYIESVKSTEDCSGSWNINNFHQSVAYTELAEFMYPDGYRDGDLWILE